MRTVLILLGNEVRRFLKDRAALSLTFLVPVILIYIFGHVFGVGRGGVAPAGINLAVVSEANSPAAAAITASLQKEKAFKVITTSKDAAGQETPLTEAKVREMMAAGSLRFALIFPADAETTRMSVEAEIPDNPRNEDRDTDVKARAEDDLHARAAGAARLGAKLGANFIGRRVRHSAARSRIDRESFGGDPMNILQTCSPGIELRGGADSLGGDSLFSSLIRIEREQVGGGTSGTPIATRSVGGWAVMFLLFSLTAAATSLFDEKKAGLYQRLLSAPVRRTQILWSKYLFGMLLGLFQLIALFIAGRLLFGIDITSNFGNLVLICLAAATACVAFGMLLAAIARSSSAAGSLGTLLILTMSAIGGAWFPTSFMPEFIQSLSKFTIVYWAIEGFIQVLWADCTTRDLLPTLGILFGLAAVVNTFSVWRFKRGDMFE
jgi:ABC-2 type transport system permease protein